MQNFMQNGKQRSLLTEERLELFVDEIYSALRARFLQPKEKVDAST